MDVLIDFMIHYQAFRTLPAVLSFLELMKKGYEIVGTENPQELQKKITEQSLEMEPVVRPLFTIVKYKEKIICSAEIPEMDAISKPCYYKGKGKSKGSYIRVGDQDLPMTDYEIHSYESFKYKIEDELRTKDRIDFSFLKTVLKYT